MKLARLGDGAEIFHTLQGEGVSMGAPAVFVRLSLCNLHCVWCDTDHTWNFEGTPWKHEKDAVAGYVKHKKEDVIIEMGVGEIAEVVRGYGCRRVVLTGGEPLLQEAGLVELMAALREDGEEWIFEVETNGTKMPGEAFVEGVGQMNVSPKLANSGMEEGLRVKPEVLRGLVGTGKAWFKFVVQGESDVQEVLGLVKGYGIPMDRLILMPEGRTVEELDKSAAWLAERCRDLGVRFSDRLHVRLWGDKRGV
ncbi:MAG: 7-carboxy-7-deazaguanine synthase QueE [Akkermansiaceae bacterium]|nr:7-carboxy-7-deazaguanine synthase QueE [Akkermansiaceae bacterium]MDP4646615.1 7-carboxy-7-deazaguanine synthase QueE [Akkermansiaceae bacterium]MDP4779824.1 7-carboxy-7-deazaguanine synthase QueE [Akkermansiaceae bacterium]MDP4846389.1 7-carboxy-7-deazaguanine synthase QueE [Akkermansiaceae bacterium]MDP4896689.1 7-carboxy-7-deazaguanine synthase QueE [Akkermansiaceae bacterium]